MGHMDGGHQLLVSGINTAATIRTGGQLRLSNAQLGGQMVAEHLSEIQHELLRTKVALLQLLHMALTKDLHGLIASRWILAIPRTSLILLPLVVAAGGGGGGRVLVVGLFQPRRQAVGQTKDATLRQHIPLELKPPTKSQLIQRPRSIQPGQVHVVVVPRAVARG